MKSLSLAQKAREGDRLSVARLITMVENRQEEAEKELAFLHSYTGKAKVIGVTGPPGAGKSTLTGKFVKQWRALGKKVAVVAVDPTSPFTGGSLLGDRLRMSELTTDPGVFIRSMSTRGSLGGLAAATGDVIRVLDAAGYEIIIVETVGVGQAEVDIMEIADSVLVITVPGLGDDIQISKAGIMEIGDVFIVNKADRHGADQIVTALDMMLDLNPTENDWRPPIIKTVATSGEGIEDLVKKVQEHFSYTEKAGLLEGRKMQRTKNEIVNILKKRFEETVIDPAEAEGALDSYAKKVYEKEMDPYQAVDEIMKEKDR